MHRTDGGAVLIDQLGTPRGRYDEDSNKFPSVMKPKFNRPVGEINNFRRLMLADFWQGALPVPAATWNLHKTQPRYFAQLAMRLSISPVC
jgi:hypothetical protein